MFLPPLVPTPPTALTTSRGGRNFNNAISSNTNNTNNSNNNNNNSSNQLTHFNAGIVPTPPPKTPPRAASAPKPKAWRVENGTHGPSRTVKLVRAWWAPVEESMKAKKPQLLESAIKTAHGTPYLRIIKVVRRSPSLKAADRHNLEVEMAARLVSARTLHSRWQSGLEEVRAAREARDPDLLGSVLARWDFADDDDEIVKARVDLRRWQALIQAIPPLLKECLQNRDIDRLRAAVQELEEDGPANVEGLDAANKLLEKYDLQVRALESAVRGSSAKEIEVALENWSFQQDNDSVLRAQATLSRRDEQKRELRRAIDARDPQHLRQALSQWSFEGFDEDLRAARVLADRYAATASELHTLVHPSGDFDFVALRKATQAWDYSKDDPKYLEAMRCLYEYKDTLVETLNRKDAWTLQRLWVLGANAGALSTENDLRKSIMAALQDYAARCEQLRYRMATLAASGGMDLGEARHALAEELQDWPFSRDDPLVQGAEMYLCMQRCLEQQRFSDLRAALESHDIVLIRSSVKPLSSFSAYEAPEVREAEDVLEAFDSGLQVVGSVALALDVDGMRSIAKRAERQDVAAVRVRRMAAAIDPKFVMETRSQLRPPRSLHLVLELLVHILSGIDPNIKDPPRDTDWRSCQRSVMTPNWYNILDSVPDWVAAGHRAGVLRALKKVRQASETAGPAWREELKFTSKGGYQVLAYVEAVFEFYALLEGKEVQALIREPIATPSSSKSPTLAKTLPLPVVPLLSGRQPHPPSAKRRPSTGAVKGERPRPKRPHTTPLALSARPNSSSSSRAGATSLRPYKDEDDMYASFSHRSEPDLDLEGSQTPQAMMESGLSWVSETTPDPLHPLDLAKEYLCNNASLAASWVLLGRDTAQLTCSLEKLRVQALAARARAIVADRVLYVMTASAVPPRSRRSLHRSYSDKIEGSQPLLFGSPAGAEKVGVLNPANFGTGNGSGSGGSSNNNNNNNNAAEVGGGMMYPAVSFKHTAPASENPTNASSAASSPPEAFQGGGGGGGMMHALPSTASSFSLSIQLLSGEFVASLPRRFDLTAGELKVHLQKLEGTSLQQMSLYSARRELADDDIILEDASIVQRGAVTLVRRTSSLKQRLELALNATSTVLREVGGGAPWQRAALEPLRFFLLGPSSGDSTAGPKPSQLEQSLRLVLRAALQVIEAGASIGGTALSNSGPPTSSEIMAAIPPVLRQCVLGGHFPAALDYIHLSDRLVRSLRAPLANLALAKRSLEVAQRRPGFLVALPFLLEPLFDFYEEYLPQRVIAAATTSVAEEAETAYSVTARVARYASTLTPMVGCPECHNAEDVAAAARTAAAQVKNLAVNCVVLPAVHIEYVRRAVDFAGECYLDNHPDAHSGDRIRWAEEVVALQLAPLPAFQDALKGIAGNIQLDDLRHLVEGPSPTSGEVRRLMAAVLWILKPETKCDASWSAVQSEVQNDTEGFLRKLCNWDLLADGSSVRLARAQTLLQEIWHWVVPGCGGSFLLTLLCGWASLVVMLLPLVDLGQRLVGAHRELKNGLARIQRAPGQQVEAATIKAWTSVLFVLDASGEPWWWLGLIRPAAHRDPPWTDGADGGVAPSASTKAKPQQGSTDKLQPLQKGSRQPSSVALSDGSSPRHEGLSQSPSHNALPGVGSHQNLQSLAAAETSSHVPSEQSSVVPTNLEGQ